MEQVSGGGTVTDLHHDQQGSTRLLTGSTGAVTGKCTYGAYGAPTCEGATTTPLGYDAQYTSSDTGLIYMRARVYDPATAQFLSTDPLAGITRSLYNYTGDNPGDAYLAAVGAQGPGPAIFDVLGLAAGVGGGAFGDEELGAYAKTYGSLLSAAAFGEPFAEDAAEARG